MKIIKLFSILFALLFVMVSTVTSDNDICANNFTNVQVPAPTSLHVGVILVQFSDWASNDDARGGHCQRHNENDHYTYQDFYRHLFSQGSYTSPSLQTHDEEDVFGSMRDFYDENSFNKFTLTGEILNDSTFNQTTGQWVPIWVTLDETQQTWENNPLSPTALLNAALTAGGFSSSGFDKMIVIFAGKILGGGLRAATAGVGGFVYQVSERTRDTRGRAQTPDTFYGIGTHSHEFGHLLGLPDLKTGNATEGHPRGISEFGLMGIGNQGFMDGDHIQNTNLGGFHAPTHLSGWSKLSLAWATYEEFTEGSVTFPHFEEDDRICVFFINDNNHNNWNEGEYFIFENRRPTFSNGSRTFDGDMTRGSTTGGLLVFHHRDPSTGKFNNLLHLEVIEADNSDKVGTTVASSSMLHFYPGTTNNTEFSPTSTPNSNDINGNPTGLAFLNIVNNNGVVSATVDFILSAPQNLAITNSAQDGQNVILAWTTNTEPFLDHYAIYRGYQDSKFDPINWLSNPSATTTNTSWTDPFVKINTSAPSFVHYRITAVDAAGANESGYSNSVSTRSYNVPKTSADPIPKEIALHANYPNPFNPETQIKFELPEPARVSLKIFNVLGEEVRTLANGNFDANFHRLTWNGKDYSGNDVPSGVYIYRIEVSSRSDTFAQTRKMTLLR